MILPDLAGATAAPALGLVPGWTLELAGSREWRTSSLEYDATIEVLADATLASATWTVVLDGLTDADHATLAAARPDDRLTIALGWADAAGGVTSIPVVGALASMLGAGPSYPTVLVGTIAEVTRGQGQFRYPTTLTGTDADHRALATTLVGRDPVTGTSLHGRVRELADRAGLSTTSHGQDVTLERAEELHATVSVLDAVHTLLQAGHGAETDRVVPAFLRDGTVHVGPCSGHEGTPVHRLEHATGLASATKDGALHRATLVGRTDVGLGDRCALDPSALPPQDTSTTIATSGWVADVVGGIGSALAGASGAGTWTELVVVGLRHRLNRADGFVTELTLGPVPDAGAATVPAADEHARSTDPARRVASRLDGAGTPGHAIGVGLVGEQRTEAGGTAEHAQRLTLHEGLAPSGEPVRAVRADLAEVPTELRDKPYLTPFAFGSTGLVVPHYPGTRVVAVHPDGLAAEALVAGSVWDEGDEPESEPGDWWLSLPTRVTEATSASDPQSVAAPEGPASHDLIDGAGGRAIHVAGFTITVGEDLMPDVGVRPDGATVDELTIRHASGNAAITIDSSGNVTIRTDKDLTLEAGQKVTVKGQQVDLVTGSTVEVKQG